jgi:acylphosphatase
MEKRISVTVTGRVQGVGYRYYVTDCAGDHGVSGYVKNNPDGTVTVVAEGEESSLRNFITALHAVGDNYIKVNDISVAWEAARQEFRDFGIRR